MYGKSYLTTNLANKTWAKEAHAFLKQFTGREFDIQDLNQCLRIYVGFFTDLYPTKEEKLKALLERFDQDCLMSDLRYFGE